MEIYLVEASLGDVNSTGATRIPVFLSSDKEKAKKFGQSIIDLSIAGVNEDTVTYKTFSFGNKEDMEKWEDVFEEFSEHYKCVDCFHNVSEGAPVCLIEKRCEGTVHYEIKNSTRVIIGEEDETD